MSSSSQYLIDILKQKFEHEVARRTVNDNILNLPIAILSVVVAGIYLMVQEINFAYSIFLLSFIIIYILVLVGSTLVTIHWLYRFYFSLGSEYKSLPSSDDIMDIYHTSITTERVVAGYFNKIESEETVVADLDAFLINAYAECTRVNTNINDKRDAQFVKAKKALGFTFVLGVMFYLVIVIVKLYRIPG